MDGLRGVAVGLVLAHHLINFAQGWVGVEIFFVLSGFLITTIVAREKKEPHFWKMFYLRRAARILPAFFLLLFVASAARLVAWRVLWPYLIFFSSNFGCLKYGQLMNAAGLGILWSLAIEEQFYLFWPMQVRRCSTRALAAGLAILMIVEPLARVFTDMFVAGWRATYFLTPLRLDGLALGALLSILLVKTRSRAVLVRFNQAILWTCLLTCTLCFPLLTRDQHILFRDSFGFSLVVITAGSVLVNIVLNPASVLVKVLSWKPLCFLGRISYGLYLCHWLIRTLIMRFAIHHGIQFSHRAALPTLLLSILLAWMSFRFYETAFTSWAKKKVDNLKEESAVMSVSG